MRSNVQRERKYTPAYRLAREVFGDEKGTQVTRYIVRLAENQSRSWSWLRQAVEDGYPIEDLVLDGVTQTVLVHDTEGGDPVDCIIPAWAEVMSEAGAGRRQWCGGAHHRSQVRPEVVMTDAYWTQVDAVPPPPSGCGAEFVLEWGSVPDRYRTVLFARTEGLSWAEVGEVAGFAVARGGTGGRVSHGAAEAFRRGVRDLLRANPCLVERFGLVECSESVSHRKGCGCKMFGFRFVDGSTIGGSA